MFPDISQRWVNCKREDPSRRHPLHPSFMVLSSHLDSDGPKPDPSTCPLLPDLNFDDRFLPQTSRRTSRTWPLFLWQLPDLSNVLGSPWQRPYSLTLHVTPTPTPPSSKRKPDPMTHSRKLSTVNSIRNLLLIQTVLFYPFPVQTPTSNRGITLQLTDRP